ncbi:hypothetical protein LWI28_016872 [Acer negundo]|uniref:Uncharacterized protein n=1 Tax=Acer negundo TaxID=4023 RepID=A0AAD5J9Z5_ACENE|nr:hypothetical protein LWI28_016872 [Acer negundo]
MLTYGIAETMNMLGYRGEFWVFDNLRGLHYHFHFPNQPSFQISDCQGLDLQMVMHLWNILKQVIYTLITMFMDMGKSEQSLVNIFTLQHKIYTHLLKEGDQLWY